MAQARGVQTRSDAHEDAEQPSPGALPHAGRNVQVPPSSPWISFLRSAQCPQVRIRVPEGESRTEALYRRPSWLRWPVSRETVPGLA
ncbi:hypothetical protein BU197_27265 [Streptomyces sp. CBMA291]|nr:hypothetical protein [Streptomyces sp. CBMA291]MBD0713325.1 hypothetical protein [Streptomyces sp. CBMA370]